MLKYLDQEEIADTTVLLRVDFNVPLTPDGRVADDSRMQYALPSIKRLLENSNRLILLSHLGKPKGKDPTLSLRPVTERLHALLPDHRVTLVSDIASLASTLQFEAGEIKFLENIRFFPEEKDNDPEFARKLAGLADIYVNDAFSVCHRKNASVIGIPPLLPSYGGLQLRKEIAMLDQLMHDPAHPFVAILGGSKISTKLPLIHKLITVCDSLLLAGGMANTIFKAQGLEIGKSLYEESEVGHARELMEQSERTVVLPTDVVVRPADKPAAPSSTVATGNIGPNESVYDIGPETQMRFSDIIASANTILWNGPVGLFEEEAFGRGTDAITDAIMGNPDAFAVLGGGDTLSAIKDRADKEKIDHISTGGGAMLTYLTEGTLPGIEALKNSDN